MLNQLLVSYLLAAGTALCLVVDHASVPEHDALEGIAPIPGVTFKHLTATRPRSRLDVPQRDKHTHHFHHLRGIKHATSGARSAAAILGAHQRAAGLVEPAYQNVTTANAYGMQYALWADIANVSVELILDTGSADTWVIADNFTCIEYSGEVVDPASCGYGPGYPAELGYQYGTVPGVHMFIKYGDGEMTIGDMGYSDITLANLTVKKQQFSIANESFWYGDNHTSGVLGLAYQALTSCYVGEWSENAYYSAEPYPPLFTSMWQQGLALPVFSIGLLRNSTSGIIAWGGVPDSMSPWDFSTVAYTDLIVANIADNPFAALDYSFYTIIPDGFSWGKTTDLTKYPCIVDTGTTLMYLPTHLADAINAAFSPPATYMYQVGAYMVACDAIAPQFSVHIGGVEMPVNPADMMFRDYVEPTTGLCMTAIADGGMGPFILGAVWMQNVLSIFDVGAAEMRFLSRPYY